MIPLVHSHRVRRRLVVRQAPRRVVLVETLGGLLARAPGLRVWAAGDKVLLGRCGVTASAGALIVGASAHGIRAAAGVLAGSIVGWRGGLLLHGREARAAAAGVRAALPDVLDRLATCVLAGMSVERALRTVTPRTPGALGEAFTAGLRALDLGVQRARAYAIIAERAGVEEVRMLMASLARAERLGTSVSAALVDQAREVRSRARAAAEAEARAAPVKLIFPLVFCFLPAFVVLTIVPIGLSAIRTIGGI